jgi:hypothetical protein
MGIDTKRYTYIYAQGLLTLLSYKEAAVVKEPCICVRHIQANLNICIYDLCMQLI